MTKRNGKAQREKRRADAAARLAALPQDKQSVAIREAHRGHPAKWDALTAAEVSA